MSNLITSLQNPRIKNVVKLLEKSQERRKQGLMVIEGFRELTIALSVNTEIDSIFYCRSLAENTVKQSPSDLGIDESLIYEVNEDVFQKMAYREKSDGFITLARFQEKKLGDIQLSQNPFVIILESIEKPGNLGAILRTADAAHIDAVIICDPRTDIYNPNVIRSSIGCIFTNQVVAAGSEEVLAWLKQNRIKSFAAALTSSDFYHQTDFTGASAIVMGTEADGLSEKWLKGADQQVKIPMNGKIDSLNVSTSCAILVFEAMRQRNFVF